MKNFNGYYFKKVINKKGFSLLKIFCLILEPFFKAAVFLRNKLYDLNLLNSVKTDSKVISIGNLKTGGSGKTPMVSLLAGYFLKQGKKVCIISSGYLNKSSSSYVVVADEHNLLEFPDEAGDEAYLLALNNKGVIVLSGDKRECVLKAGEKYKPDIIIIDDGFQSRYIKRDIDIVLIDGTDSFSNGHMLPAGLLREPLKALARAQIMVITKISYVFPDALKKIITTARGYNKTAPIFKGIHKEIHLYGCVKNDTYDLNFIKNKKVMAFSGLADNASFFNMLYEYAPASLFPVSFPDHYNYDPADIETLRKTADNFDLVVTTEKDFVRIKHLWEDIKMYILKIDFKIQESFYEALENML